MERSTLATVTLLLLLNISVIFSLNISTSTHASTQNIFVTPERRPKAASCPPAQPLHLWGRIYWKGKACEGLVLFSAFEMSEAPLCLSSSIDWNKLCYDKRCGAFQNLKPTQERRGYKLTNTSTILTEQCIGLYVTCQDGLGAELTAYKSVTGVLVFLLSAALLLLFGRSLCKAVTSRFSQKQQNRWIGPTQSQSVSYHRGQVDGPANNNTLKRQSFPGLERLTVNISRESSSNRNSDYDSYGYN